MGTMLNQEKVSSSLFGKARRAVLALIFGRADQSFYLRQIVRSVGAGQGAVQRELARLSGAGVLLRIRQGNQVYYRANPDSPIFSELKSIVIKTAGVGEALKTALEKLAGRIQVAFLYGSFVSGRETKESDVDVMIVGSVSFSEVVAVIRPVQEVLAREVNPVVYSAQEFKKKLREKHHFLATVLKSSKIFLIGGRRELKKLAAKRLAR